MEYLNRILGVKVEYEGKEEKTLPNYLASRYDVKKVFLDDISVFFVYPKGNLEQVIAVKKHIRQIKKMESLPVVIVLKKMTFYQRENFIREKIPFIVEGKQIYLPFMGVYLQERCDAEVIEKKELLPSSQLLLLYFIYRGAREIIASKAAKDLRLTATSISRASRELEQLNIIKTRRQGVQKVIFSERSPEELYKSTKEIMSNPVKRRVYIPKSEKLCDLPKSGDLALSEYSMLNPPTVEVYAASNIAKWKDVMTNRLQNADLQVAIELWRYDPMLLTKVGNVDPISLALSFENEEDERVEEAIEEMLDKVWREVDGKRN